MGYDRVVMKTTCSCLPFFVAAALCGSLFAQEAAPPAAKAAEKLYAFRTSSGFYLTAENGGGSVVNTDRKELGPWETFTMVQTAPGVFAFRTEDGHFLSDSVFERARRGGRPQQQQQQMASARGGLVATQTTSDGSAQFKLMVVNPEGPIVVLVTSAGKYVTAENSGGMKARSSRAMATDRAEIGDWELFTLVDVEKFRAGAK